MCSNWRGCGSMRAMCAARSPRRSRACASWCWRPSRCGSSSDRSSNPTKLAKIRVNWRPWSIGSPIAWVDTRCCGRWRWPMPNRNTLANIRRSTESRARQSRGVRPALSPGPRSPTESRMRQSRGALAPTSREPEPRARPAEGEPAAAPETRAAARPGARPLRLFAISRPLAAPTIAADGAPLEFVFRGEHERVVRAWGPERIETGWWRGRCSRRDYYRVETARGSRFWLFRRHIDGRWFLHGEFA